jgi:murein tripeptide amidase MpaA
MLKLHDRFHSGNIDVVEATSPENVRLRIRPDHGSSHLQWFHFRVSGAKGTPLRLVIENAKDASYESAWHDYQACASYDTEHWFRVKTRYRTGELRIEHTPAFNSVHYAYFAPYPHTRHAAFVGRMQQAPGVDLEVLGQTLDGRELDLVTLGRGDVPIWVIGRQHPGESMAEWLIEGLLERLADPADALSKRLLDDARFFIVPNMNPDGSARGHLRTNACGANLNREWEEPDMERSPEVALVRDRMDASGLRFCLDVHGDEELPYNFIAGADGVEGLSPAVVEARHRYEDALVTACPDFQTKEGYTKSAPGRANMTMATNHLAARFDALAMTLEQPFKDNANAPMPDEGWSPRRAKVLGRAQLDALAAVLPMLSD